ncbi:MAG TPA: M48 family metallopeptidase [Lentimicrobium sp.]|nr:M48 family metallopeptidase [Lentimicrobium sp.]
MADKLFLLIICMVCIGYLIGAILKFYNNLWRKKPIPDEISDVYSIDKYIQYQEYKRETYKFSVITSTLSLILTLIMLFVGFSLVDSVIRTYLSNEIWISIAFFGVIGFLSDIVSTPFDIYETFVIEQKYGFNTMTKRTFILDKLKSYLLAVIIGVPVLFLIIWFYQSFSDNFWWMTWILISIISIALSYLYSNLIVPVFNKQTPLEEGELKNNIEKLASKTKFNLQNVYVIDGSKRSSRANAYFSGFGSKKRIVLYDTLIKTLSIDEIVSVLAHEIGHYKRKHTIKGLILSILQTGFLLFLLSVIIDADVIYESLGTPASFHIGVIIFIILYSPVSFIISLGMNHLSRQHEYQADFYAKEHSSADALISGLKSLTSNNMSDLTPHPWYVWAYYSHPPLLKRIRAISYPKHKKLEEL